MLQPRWPAQAHPIFANDHFDSLTESSSTACSSSNGVWSQVPRVALHVGRISGFFIRTNQVYAIDSESGPLNHPNWRDGVRVGPLDEDRIVAFIPPFDGENRVYQGTADEGIAVDADGNVYAAEGPNSLNQAGWAFAKYAAK